MKLSVNCALTDKTRLFKGLERRFNAVLLAHWAFLRLPAGGGSDALSGIVETSPFHSLTGGANASKSRQRSPMPRMWAISSTRSPFGIHLKAAKLATAQFKGRTCLPAGLGCRQTLGFCLWLAARGTAEFEYFAAPKPKCH